ncbi:hypothetical protein FQN57_003990 [Myotisia sp. PD_48]|nr:hypothetical protein FQN57_003990 [Myotisia sp. PD_48]
MGSVELFTGKPQEHSFDGLLFDFDGTIIDSTDGKPASADLDTYLYDNTLLILAMLAVVKHWHIKEKMIQKHYDASDTSKNIASELNDRMNRIGKELGLDANEILKTSHGRRSIDVFKIIAPEKANWEYVSFVEGRIPKEYGSDAVEIPGARQLLDSLDEARAPWAVVTSGSNALFTGWLSVLKLPHPKHFVVAEDVSIGKPDPTCFKMGRSRLGLGDNASMLVVEDAPSGIRAGKAAGFKVIAVATTHRIDQLKEAGADWIIEDLRSLKLKKCNGPVVVEISNILQ